MSTVREVDFLIVGAGPVGSALALSLSAISKEISVVLIDQNPEQPADFYQSSESPFDTKVFAINSGSRQLLDKLDVWADLVSPRCCAYKRMHVWDSEGTGSVTFSADEFNHNLYSRLGLEITESKAVEELGFIAEARVVQSALDRKISSTNNIQICRPARIEHVEWPDEPVQNDNQNKNLTLIKLDTGECFATGLLCAADGARSSLRQLAAIETLEENCEQKALVANVQLSQLHENCAWQIFRPTGPLAFLPLLSETQRDCSIVWSMDTTEAERVEGLDEAEFLIELERAVESRFGALKLTSKRLSFPLWQRHALDYGVPGMVLVGDSAHSIHPLAGLGANLGFQDVACLSRELNRAFKRNIPFNHQAVISRYQRQRRLDNELTLKAMMFFKTSFADQGMLLNSVRNLGLRFFSEAKPIKNLVARHAFMSGD